MAFRMEDVNLRATLEEGWSLELCDDFGVAVKLAIDAILTEYQEGTGANERRRVVLRITSVRKVAEPDGRDY